MAQFGKASAKRSKPSYFMAILGVTIVLFFVGVFGWLLLNTSRYTEKLKEDIKLQVYLRRSATQADVDTLMQYIKSRPYTNIVEYIDKEAAKKQWMAKGETDFQELLDENPLPASIDFNLKSMYVEKDTIAAIKADLEQRQLVVESVKYPAFVVEKMGSSVRAGLIVFASLAALFCILSIVLIDNTIRLAMYSNRFLIKTMQMVGATRGFIAKPLNMRAVLNGLIAALVAIFVIYGLMMLSEYFLPDLSDLRDNSKVITLFVFLIVLGISISLFSTYRSVVKYLKMKLDELY
ncbi:MULTISPECIES: cell division protein FtsX [Niastella]|uniref:Cell division protein FtsX n=1 Tax=Niastella soli TaxID=2821487 RepID=A0ABS3YRB8_9BACT|nr:permease-like cell division protein FtsX [Niastella soli]MBO9200338.1 permease-like cell division protein FtsX [Niastella soli]